jgi:hypothetical protein
MVPLQQLPMNTVTSSPARSATSARTSDNSLSIANASPSESEGNARAAGNPLAVVPFQVADTATSSWAVRGESVRTTVITAGNFTESVSETIARLVDSTLATAIIRECLENKSRPKHLSVHVRSYHENSIDKLDV